VLAALWPVEYNVTAQSGLVEMIGCLVVRSGSSWMDMQIMASMCGLIANDLSWPLQ
jgi:hypothetical protein